MNIGIGFVTGRKHFQNVLKLYINNWVEHGLLEDKNIHIHIFVAYDLKYHGTKISDYKNVPPELAKQVASLNFYGAEKIEKEISYLKKKKNVNDKEAKLLFGEGYGRKRNVVTYFAIKNKMDRLIFIDDDEYPIATMKNEHNRLIWMGQSVVATHLKFSADAHITHGHHCGYISPIPYIRFNKQLTEADFKMFIEGISNEIVTWEKIKYLTMHNNGVTYADTEIINKEICTEVDEEMGMKFISGANLCFNLSDTKNLPPFYNPPGARGEDTFMSTALSQLKVLKVPCYTFHDGFLMYDNLLNGVLPVELEPIDSISPVILKRFISVTIGWIRYKPLMVYITNRDNYNDVMQKTIENLNATVDKLCIYFKTEDFKKIHGELKRYMRNVEKHFKEFEATKTAWRKLMSSSFN